MLLVEETRMSVQCMTYSVSGKYVSPLHIELNALRRTSNPSRCPPCGETHRLGRLSHKMTISRSP